ncbi:M23 family metallopeptidase [Paenibacillus arenilitoris]|uniref:Peptidoglycan DD-metalloendopeptidase family protein n=1 Tax=Paenibacillus arenilitoris TaxID=2772299 RepID=A0A927CJW8_9BACL|nr:M23 family metallopeptidase [Paenibacillus arenilitoris]MBD2868884.1 peptidoglycan DD-metalloendopeptidase family protein [Paenibacillus arenilitoris]
MNWLSKRFTFVIIPEANQSVRQYRVSGLALVLAPALALLLGLFALVIFALFSRASITASDLKGELSSSADRYELRLSEKDASIDSLRSDLLRLSEQARSMEGKMAEVKALEAQLKQLAGIDAKAPVSVSSLVAEEGGQGGEELELPGGSAAALAGETAERFADIGKRLETMLPQLEDTKEAVIAYKEMLRITPTIWPTDSRKVTSLFGMRKDPFTGRTTYHSGIDIGGSTGDPIYAAADGVVTLSENDRVHGHNIMIDHGRGISTRYLHLSKRVAGVGDKVAKGQSIGELGSTGRSTGPHLHYEVYINGETVNPEPYITADRKEP